MIRVGHQEESHGEREKLEEDDYEKKKHGDGKMRREIKEKKMMMMLRYHRVSGMSEVLQFASVR